MDIFRWLSVVVSTVLGLGIARILASAVSMFHARRTIKTDWLSVVWATMIFFQQILFWWSLEDLTNKIPHWNIGYFLLLVTLVVVLFLAAALILPTSDHSQSTNLRNYFEQDGRWALVVLAVFNGIAIMANHILWNAELVSWQTVPNALACTLPVIVFFCSRKMQIAATSCYVLVIVFSAFTMTPHSY